MPVRRCDRCGSTNSIDVTATRGQDVATLALCSDCWGKFIADFHPIVTRKQTRNMYRVIDPEDIPRT